LFLTRHVAARRYPSVDFRLLKLHAARFIVFIERDVAEPFPAADGLVRRVVGMIGAQFLNGHVGVFPRAILAELFADGLDFRDAVKDVGDGLRQLVECDGV